MGAAFRTCRRRGIVVLASGTAILLTALTGGITPAIADPAEQPVITTPVNPPKPERQAPRQNRMPEVAPAPSVVIPSAPAVVPAQPEPPAQADPPARHDPPAQQELPAQQDTPAQQPPKPAFAPKPAPVATQAPTVTTTVENTPVVTPDPPKQRNVAPAPAEPATTGTPSSPKSVPHKESTQAGPSAVAPPAVAKPSANEGTPASPPAALQSPGASPSNTGKPANGSQNLVPEPENGTSVQPSAAVPSVSLPVSHDGQVLEVHQAEKLKAPEQDVQIAKTSAPVEQKPPAPAPKAEIDDLRKTITTSSAQVDKRHDLNEPAALRDNRDNRVWDRNVRQFDRDWVQYDDYYRPVLCNPYHDTIKIVYVYDNYPRIVYIPPLARIVLDAIRYAAYSFTAFVLDPIGTAIDIAVGTFFGGYYPGPYLPYAAPPPPPPPLLTYDNVPVVVNYSDATYDPFVVRRIVDVGDDARYGEHKVLLDGVTPAWGVWNQTPDGQRQFEVHKTQQFPGLEDPSEAPLPGNYQLRLANDSSGISAKSVYFIVADAVVATLALCAAVAFGISRRRARLLH